MNDKSIIAEAKDVLIQLAESISTLSFDEYNEKISLLSNSTIGEHTRHIIELFQQLLSEYEGDKIDYDKRKRNTEIQQNIDHAVECIANIICSLEKDNKTLLLHTVYHSGETVIETNYFRELMYNFEHCVHHQAIIKIAFLHLGKSDLEMNFGVAKSTIMFRNQSV